LHDIFFTISIFYKNAGDTWILAHKNHCHQWISDSKQQNAYNLFADTGSCWVSLRRSRRPSSSG